MRAYRIEVYLQSQDGGVDAMGTNTVAYGKAWIVELRRDVD